MSLNLLDFNTSGIINQKKQVLWQPWKVSVCRVGLCGEDVGTRALDRLLSRSRGSRTAEEPTSTIQGAYSILWRV